MTLNPNYSNLKGFIFDIQGLSVHDGPGCRTLIFMKGCTLNCFWCCNPEGISPKPTLMYYEAKCIACKNCIENCSSNAIKVENGKLLINRNLCAVCENQNCYKECYTDALKMCGYEISISKLMGIIKRDRRFWGSEGGITLTGGEPLLQIDFVKELLSECHQSYIHNAIETCGNVPKKNFQEVMPWLDWIFFDLKHFNGEEHKKATHFDNKQILENASFVAKEFPGRVIFRLPLIPDFNDSKENIDSLISFLKETGRNEINILPLHHLGKEKYQKLNREYLGTPYSVPTKEKIAEIERMFSSAGINCYIGSGTPF